jgi:peptidoglycan biosynthesis protein MviN/MurJ (putative lipid II flippase)
LAAFFDTVALTLIFRKRYGGLGFRDVGRSCLKFAVAAGVMGGAIIGVLQIPGILSGSLMQRALGLTVTIGMAAGVYFVAARILGVRELREMRGMFSGREAS